MKCLSVRLLTASICLAFQNLPAASSDEWPMWRGPDTLGISPSKGLPTSWSATEGVAWKAIPPGKGASSPIVVGGRVVVTTQTSDTGLHVLAYASETGRLLWDREIAKGSLPAHNLHNMATPTAAATASHIWALFGTGDLACLTAEGAVVWQRNLVKEFGNYNTNHGMGSSPVLFNNRLYVACMHQGPSYLLCIDPLTGKNHWKQDRNLKPKDESQDSYSSPLPVTTSFGPQIILAGAEAINGYDPSSGRQLWSIDDLKVPHPYGRTIAGPTAGGDHILFVASGFQNQGFTMGVKLTAPGAAEKVWQLGKFSPDCPTPLILDELVYLIRDDGMGSCVELKSGTPLWQERLFTANVKVSPVAGDGHIYLTSGQANTLVLRAGRQFHPLATNMLGEATLSTPALAAGKVFLRTEAGLYAFKGQAAPTPR